ncbi:MAG: ribulose phosphate epimerase [Nannocystaceae bacterium]
MKRPSMPRSTSCVLLACGLAALATSVACGTDVPTFGLEAGSSTGAEPGSGSSTSGTTTEPEPGSDSSDSSDSGSNFIEDPDGGGAAYECDPFTQNCPAGQKCMYWADDGGSSWNATRCSDVAPDADELGQPCTVQGNGTSGIDSCELGTMCWDVDPEFNVGTCVELCTGSESDPSCSDPSMICAGRGPFLCLPTCCPIEQDCPLGQGCYPVNETFSCAPDASGEQGGYGDPCEFINVCDPGLACIDADAVPSCSGSIGCCTTYCEIDEASCSRLDPALECVPWYDEGTAPPGLELIGVCAVP